MPKNTLELGGYFKLDDKQTWPYLLTFLLLEYRNQFSGQEYMPYYALSEKEIRERYKIYSQIEHITRDITPYFISLIKHFILGCTDLLINDNAGDVSLTVLFFLVLHNLPKNYCAFSLDMDGCAANYPMEVTRHVYRNITDNNASVAILDSASARNVSLLDDVWSARMNRNAGTDESLFKIKKRLEVISTKSSGNLQTSSPIQVELSFNKNLEQLYIEKGRPGFPKIYYTWFENKVFLIYHNLHKHAVFFSEKLKPFGSQLHEYFYDDRLPYAQAVYESFKKNPQHIPKNVFLHVVNFPIRGTLKPNELGIVEGIGDIDFSYEDTIGALGARVSFDPIIYENPTLVSQRMLDYPWSLQKYHDEIDSACQEKKIKDVYAPNRQALVKAYRQYIFACMQQIVLRLGIEVLVGLKEMLSNPNANYQNLKYFYQDLGISQKEPVPLSIKFMIGDKALVKLAEMLKTPPSISSKKPVPPRITLNSKTGFFKKKKPSLMQKSSKIREKTRESQWQPWPQPGLKRGKMT